MSNIGVSGIWVCDVGMRFSEDKNLVDNLVPIWGAFDEWAEFNSSKAYQ